MAAASPTPPYHLPLSTALQRSESLAGLMQRLRQSQARWAALAPHLPAELRAVISAGPLDDTAWVLLAANAAAAAKLRQWVPELQAQLLAGGWNGPPIKIKVAARA